MAWSTDKFRFLMWSQLWRLGTLVHGVEKSCLYLSNNYEEVKKFQSPSEALHLDRLRIDILRN